MSIGIHFVLYPEGSASVSNPQQLPCAIKCWTPHRRHVPHRDVDMTYSAGFYTLWCYQSVCNVQLCVWMEIIVCSEIYWNTPPNLFVLSMLVTTPWKGDTVVFTFTVVSPAHFPCSAPLFTSISLLFHLLSSALKKYPSSGCKRTCLNLYFEAGC